MVFHIAVHQAGLDVSRRVIGIANWRSYFARGKGTGAWVRYRMGRQVRVTYQTCNLAARNYSGRHKKKGDLTLEPIPGFIL